MDRNTFLNEIKIIIENEAGCMVKTTPKKKDGFVPYNRHGIKWGQVDTGSEKYIRLVFDLKPHSLEEGKFLTDTKLKTVPKGKIVSGYRYTLTEKANGHDQLIVFLEDLFLEEFPEEVEELKRYIQTFVEESGFKSQPTRA